MLLLPTTRLTRRLFGVSVRAGLHEVERRRNKKNRLHRTRALAGGERPRVPSALSYTAEVSGRQPVLFLSLFRLRRFTPGAGNTPEYYNRIVRRNLHRRSRILCERA